MPKGKGSATKKTQPECDLCGETICPNSQDSLQCEDCQSYMHRYCAGMTRSHYHELCSKSTPFVCMVCTQRSQRVIIQQLQNEVTALRSELVKLREAGSLETSATPEINKAALDALKDDVQQLKSSIHGYSTQSKQAKPSYARMAATTNSRKPPHKPAKGPHSAGEFPSITAKVKVTGARKIWGTMRESTVRSVKGVISKLCKIKPGFKVKRKDQPGDSFHKPKWWFVIHADESDLAKLDSGWGVVSDHTSWKIQFCYKPADSPNATLSHADVPEFQNNQAPQTHPAPVSEPASPLTPDAAESSPFLGVTPGETEQGLLLH